MLNLLKEIHFAKKILHVYFARRRLLKLDSEFFIQDFGSGSKFDKRGKRKISNIVRHSCSPIAKSMFIALIARWNKAKVILEMGTCIGTNALILGIINPQAQIVTIEGDSVLYRFARRLARIFNQKNLTFICGNFDEVLPGVLTTYKPDFVFVDGNHSEEATVQYFRQICGRLTGKAIVFFDDIDWSRGMRNAWEKIWCTRIKKKIGFVKFGIISLHKN